MSKTDAVAAYRDSLYDNAEYDLERVIGSRTTPIVGGLWPGLKQIGNGLWRPFKVGGAWMFGYEGAEREFPKQPEVPETLKNSSLGNAFNESWKLKEESTKARVEGIDKLLGLDISGWWQKASIASHAEAVNSRVILPEEGMAQDAAMHGGNAGFVASLMSDRGSSGQGR